MYNPFIPPSEATTKVTCELRDLVENGVNIWDFDYPSFYEGEAKKAFERKVIDHYYFRQIGQETPARWLHYFRSRMREIMPYYIQLYRSVELMESVEDPFKAYDLTETYTEERTDDSESTSKLNASREGEASADRTTSTERSTSSERSEDVGETNSTASEKRFSNTPQGSIENLDRYMTEATKENGNGDRTVVTSGGESGTESVTGSDKTTDTDKATETSDRTDTHAGTGSMKYTLTRQGNIGVQPLGQEIRAYREALINVDQMVINELNDLFLLIY